MALQPRAVTSKAHFANQNDEQASHGASSARVTRRLETQVRRRYELLNYVPKVFFSRLGRSTSLTWTGLPLSC